MSLPFSGDPASAAFPRVRPVKPVPLFQCDECEAVSRPPTNELIHQPDCSFTAQSTPMPPARLVELTRRTPDDRAAYFQQKLIEAMSQLADQQTEIARLRAENAELRRELDGAVAYLAEIDQHADKRKAQILLGVISERDAEIARLRGLLARLEWSAPMVMDADTQGVCPVCYGGPPASGHMPDCWLAAELGRLADADATP